MSDARKIFDYSASAQAAYAFFANPAAAEAALQVPDKANFSATEAARFSGTALDPHAAGAQGIQLWHHQPNDSTGFSASVFFDRAANKHLLAIRGTEQPLVDVTEDILRIGVQGFAGDQLVSLYRYYRKLTTAAGQAVQYSDAEISALQCIRLGIPANAFSLFSNVARSAKIRQELALDVGLTPLHSPGASVIPAGAPLIVTGHSLGGHLALLFGRFFPEVTEHVYTYNAPGISAVGELALRALGIPPSPPSLVTNVSAVMGDEAISKIWSKPGESIGIATEPGSVVHQHSIVPLTDTLALYGAIATLSPIASAGMVSGIIAATSPFPEDGIEVLLDDLRVLLGTVNSSTLIAKTGADRIERENYYQNLYALLDSRESGRDYQIESLTGKSAAEIAKMATTDISVRYALDELNPFIARNASYSHFDGEFSGSWIAARAEMLAGVLEGNRLDQPFGLSGSDDSVLYSDIDSGATFSMLSDAQAQIALPLHRSNQREAVQNALEQATYRRKVVFGSDSSTGGDEIAGLSGNDRLLGGGGADELDGLAGDDVLDGGEGNDVLRGGEGDDVLSGGVGADRLEGGAGQDTYLFGSSFDADTIVDRDGRVFLGEDVLTGGRGTDGGEYVGADGRLTYVLEGELDSGGTLTVNGSLRIEDFRNGDLGIRLWDTQDPGEDEPFVPAVETILIGDYVYDEHIVAPPVAPVDEFGNPTPATRAAADPGRVDTYEQFPGTPDNTHFLGGGGDDILQDILSGDDWLELGTGNDAGWGGEGNDLVEGGPGRDIVAGGRGDDLLYAGTRESLAEDLDDAAASADGGDLLSGGDGDDLIYGDASANRIEGGAGADRIRAGAGNDGINSYGYELSQNERYEIHPPNNDWVNRSVDILWFPSRPLPMFNEGSGGTPGSWRIPNSSSTGAALAPDGADFIDAGSGDDTVFAGDDDDVVAGGTGNDYIDMGTGQDNVRGGDGDDYILLAPDTLGDFADGGAGNDTIIAQFASGDSRLEGGSGNDVLKSGFGTDIVVGGEGDDFLESSGGDDVLYGGDGNDILRGLQGSPLLDGGAGADQLLAFVELGGVSTFRWGEGYDTDLGFALFGDVDLQIAGNVAPGDVVVSDQELVMPGALLFPDEFVAQLSRTVFSIEEGAQKFFLFQFPEELSDIFGLPRAGDLTVHFADGTVWDDAYIESLLEAPEEPEDLPLAGSDEADVVYGTAGTDTISGAAGDDFLVGGEGEDTYLYADGDGFDRVEDIDATPGNTDALQFADGIDADGVSVFAIENDYVLETENGGVRLMGGRTVEGAVESIEFANGTRWTLADLEARAEVLPGNRAPEMPESFGSVSADPGNRVEFALPGNAVSDLDRFDAVNLFAITADGERLPGWLQFDAASRTLSGTPGQGDAGVHELLFIAADASGAAAAGSFTIQVGAGAPALAHEPATPAMQVVAAPPPSPLQVPAVEPVGADVAAAPTLSAPAPAPRENAFDAAVTINAALEAPRVFTDSAEPAFRDIQHRLDVLLQTGRTNLGERYAEAIREFEERRLEREEVPEPPPPTEEEIEAWNSAMHAWHDRHPGFTETELGGGDGAWGMGWGFSGPEGSPGGAGVGSLSGIANPNLHARLQGVASAPALSEGLQNLR